MLKPQLFALIVSFLSAPSAVIANGQAGVLTLLAAALAGGLVGILINYLADVLPAARRLGQPVCPCCNQLYALKDYVLIRGCPTCGQRRSRRTIIVMAASLLASVLLALFPLPGLGWWGSLPVMVFLGVIAVIDIEHRLVLVETSLFGLGLCVIFGVIQRGFAPTLTGGLGGFLVMLTLFFLGIVFSKIVGKLRGRNVSQVAFGFGDVFAGAFLGLLTGWPLIAGAIMIGMLTFAVYSIVYIAVLLVTKRYSAFATALPLAPFLIIGAVVMLYL